MVEGACPALVCIMPRGGRKEGRKEGKGGLYIFCVCSIYAGMGIFE